MALALSCLSAVMAWSTTQCIPRTNLAPPRTAGVTMMSVPDAAKSGYLVYDDGFVQEFLVSATALAGVAAALSYNEIVVQATMSKLGALGWGVLGLLSSACCLFQVILNALSVGCAGFNNVLGPLRPHFLALAAVAQAWVWVIEVDARAHGAPADESVVVGALLCVSLSFMPEALAVWVEKNGDATRGDGAMLMLRVSGMGCSACSAKVQDTLVAVAGVAAVAVDLEAESATLQLDGEFCEERDLCEADVWEEAMRALDAAGFGGQLA